MEQALQVTLELLAERSFDDISISEILERSGQSAGQFYARFASKEAVFQELCRRFEAGVQDRVEAEMIGWAGLPLAERVRRLVRLVAILNVENRPVLRSMLLRVWRDPGGHERLAKEVRNERFERLLLEQLRAEGADGCGATADERSVRGAMEIIAAACRHELLFGPLARAEIDDRRIEELVDLLTRFALGVLTGEME